MRNMILSVFFVVLVLFLVTGCSSELPDKKGMPAGFYSRACASVNGHFIKQKDLEDLVISAYGPQVLDEMVTLELLRQYAADKGVGLTDEMYQNEYQSFMDEIAPGKNPADQLAIFDFVLTKKGISKDIFDLYLKKQALIKAVCDKNVVVTDKMLADEFYRQYGEKRTARIIAVNSMRKIDEVEKAISNGADFRQVALSSSEDEVSLRNDALTDLISSADNGYPAALINRIFALKNVGDISGTFLANFEGSQMWYIVKLESIVPAEGVSFEQVKDVLSASLTKKQQGNQVVELQNKLRDDARIIIMDKRLN